ncbi:MAG: glycosyltransferase [bacterium]|nr:glycosyltransferase [bacterium]
MSTELLILRVAGDRAVGVTRHLSPSGGTRHLSPSGGTRHLSPSGGTHLAADEVRLGAPTHDRAVREFHHLIHAFPQAAIAWLDERLEPWLSPPSGWRELMQHPLEVLHVSCFQRCDLQVESLGLVDFDSSFLLPGSTENRFVTWLISPLAGIGSAAAFRTLGFDPTLESFQLALFDFGLRGIKEGLCPCSEPALVGGGWPDSLPENCRRPLSSAQLATLVRRHFGRKWIVFWLLAGLLFDRRLRGIGAWRGWRAGPSPAAQRASLAALLPQAEPGGASPAIEVLIPTLGRAEHVRNLLHDLTLQSLVPRRVVLVEQRAADTPDPELEGIEDDQWPFAVDRYRVPWTGACRARNLGLARLRGEWVLLLDDDVRVEPAVVRYLYEVARAYGVDAVAADIRTSPPQEIVPRTGESVPRVWPFFTTCTALVSRRACEAVQGFDECLEGGFGEDYEFGIRLRLRGFNVLRAGEHPVLHLKAPAGGFRHPFPHPWIGESVVPRPSPTVLYSRRKHQRPSQQHGYLLFYWGKRLAATPFYRWPSELVALARQWRSAVRWCDHLLRRHSEGTSHLSPSGGTW